MIRSRGFLLGISACLAALLALYYSYLASLYLVDEVYDGEGPRELDLAEKLAIRVTVVAAHPDAKTLLESFVAKYSLCPCVEELQVIWNAPSPAPKPTDFIYAHTHSRVTVYTAAPDAAAILSSTGLSLTATAAILLMDLRTDVDCNDVAFAHNVWRSGKSTLVGFFPRLHRKNVETGGYSYYSWPQVWWNGVYSLLLPKGLIVSKVLLEKLLASTVLATTLQQHPQCVDLAYSVYAAHENGHPPVWVSVPVSVSGTPSSSEVTSFGSADKGGECLTLLTAALKVEHLPYSRHKSSRASDFIFWGLV